MQKVRLLATMVAVLAMAGLVHAGPSPSPFAGSWLSVSDLPDALDTGLIGKFVNIDRTGKVSVEAWGFDQRGKPKRLKVASGRVSPDGLAVLRMVDKSVQRFYLQVEKDALWAVSEDGNEEVVLQRIGATWSRGSFSGWLSINGAPPLVCKVSINPTGNVTFRVRDSRGREVSEKGLVTVDGHAILISRNGFELAEIWVENGALHAEGVSILGDGTTSAWWATFPWQ